MVRLAVTAPPPPPPLPEHHLINHTNTTTPSSSSNLSAASSSSSIAGGSQSTPDGSLPSSPPLIHTIGGAAQQQQQQQHQTAITQQTTGGVCALHPHMQSTSSPAQLPPQITAFHQQQHQMAAQMSHHHMQQQHQQQQQQQQQQQHHHPHENGHGAAGNGNGNGTGPPPPPPQSQQQPPPSAGPGGLYIPYAGEFYPTEHGYFISAPHPHHHHHEMCPAHHPAAMCTMPSEFGPTTVQMVSQNRPPQMPVPVQVPQGQMMQQYVNENGITTVVLSPTQYQQLHAAGQGGVPHIHAPFITANGTTSHFYSPLATGYPGPGGAQHFHQMTGGHLQSQQMSHSPSPPSNYHKDERSQRQHTKLLRKLDQKREMSSTMSTPAHSPSPRKNDLNGLRRTSRNGASSVGTSEDGEESSSVPDEEDDCQVIIEQLSSVQSPEVTDITSRSAMLRWEAPTVSENLINTRDLRYDVLLSDRGKEGKYKLIFKGESYVCMIQDLRPGQEYFVCLQVHFDKLQGSASEPTVFTTPACEPDQPLPPKLIQRTKSSLQLRWNAPPDNGSHIQTYVLEYDEGKGRDFVEIIKMKGKQYTLGKLQPSTRYRFRLAAINECGPSIYSEIVLYHTSGNPPQTPKPPQLQSATPNSLRLAWDRRGQEEEFILQMADRESGHGFLNMYNGLDTSYECKNLKRATAYQFRLRAENEAGSSSWSNDVTYKTLPERPGRPAKPQVKGKIHGTYFKAKWDPPSDQGGAEIKKYFLEISSGAKFDRVYTGAEPEAVCDRLSPGTTYQIRVSCEGPGGLSNFSDLCTVTTEAVVPGQPDPPFFSNPPGPYAAVLRWERPLYNGGAPVLEYELQLNGSNFVNEVVYRGKENHSVVKDLQPGEEYQVNVRAVNRIGAGIWSEALRFSAGAAPPFAPDAPEIEVRSPTHLTLAWKEPLANGSSISEYRLESSTSSADVMESFSVAYQGLQTSTDLRNLIPFTFYYFRLCASNSAGTSPYSSVVSTQTPAAVPSAPQIKTYEITASEITLQWSEPEANGSEISHYVIEYADRSVTTETNGTEYTLKKLSSETTYKLKVQAVNEIGASQFSSTVKLTTLPPPPKAPRLECTGIGHNFIKLKWGEGRNVDFTRFYIEMYNSRAKEFQNVYKGTSFMCKVNKLQEMTAYVFKICSETDKAGTGDYSEEYVFTTIATIPSSIKAPRVCDEMVLLTCTHCQTCGNPSLVQSPSELNSATSGCSAAISGKQIATNAVCIEWQHSKNTFSDPTEYELQCSFHKETDYKQLYRGSDTRHTVEDLLPGIVYYFRVLPVRKMSSGEELVGSFSPSLRYQVPPKAIFEAIDAVYPQSQGSGLAIIQQRTVSMASNSQSHHAPELSEELNKTGSVIAATASLVGSGVSGTTTVNVGTIRRFLGKVNAIYSNRKRMSDQEKAILFMVFFIVGTVVCAALVRLFMR